MRRRGDRKLTVESVTEALKWSGGLVTAASRKLGCHTTTLYSFMNENPALKAVREEISEALVDLAENTLYRAIREGDLKAVMFFLDRRGRHRGYGWKAEVTGRDGAPVQFELEDARAVLQERLDTIAGRFKRAGEKPDETRH
ncbi:MAG: hypothetical protein EOS85_11550 [Mesorhizobium sp.]|nr:MAG: hypothetical protein EOS85_11550 [Mesorhizobium sp.]